MKIVSLVILALGTSAFAQTSTTTAPSAPAEATSTVANVSTTVAPASKWGMTASIESSTGIGDQKELGSKAVVQALSAVGLVYKLSPAWSLELRQYISSVTNRENLTSARYKILHENSDNAMDYTMVRAKNQTGFSLFGSKAVAWESRYYMPIDRASRENKENGIVRFDVAPEWEINPRWTIGAYASPRFYLRSSENPNTAVGSDADYRMILGPNVGYAFNDKLSAYYFYYGDVRSRGVQRGDFTMDVANTQGNEIGMNWTVGPVTLNPFLNSEVSLNDRHANLVGDESRTFSHETTSYNLNVYASF